MKRLNKKGFTLIELLAVIVIMGVLMIVAIPAVSRTIENARRDSFADTAKEYINSVRNAVLADNISCTVGGNTIVASATPSGKYFYRFKTVDGTGTDLMESGGKSPFGNAEISGIVRWEKTVDANGKTTTKYDIHIQDSSEHGWAGYIDEAAIARSKVTTGINEAIDTDPAGYTKCELN